MKVVFNTTKNILPHIIIIALFILMLIGVISYARGYRFNLQEGTISSTGIISINSSPKGAKVYINDELRGATDTNITLPYGQYDVEVKKEGYSSWKKSVVLKGEIVMSLNAVLFSKNPSLTPLTNIGVNAVHSVGNTDKVILVSETGDAEQDGIYLFEPSGNPVTLFPPLKLLVLRSLVPETVNFASAEFTYGPRYRQTIITFSNPGEGEFGDTTKNIAVDVPEKISYLISLDEENLELFEIATSIDDIIAKWHEEKNKEMVKIIETLPKSFQKIASDSFHIISLSPDEKRVMYLAKDDASLPKVIDPPLIGANQTEEERDIKENGLYIYDKKEDKNYFVPIEIPFEKTSVIKSKKETISGAPGLPDLVDEAVATQVLDMVRWYPTSDYIVIKEAETISVLQYDGSNKETVYAGPFDRSFFGISPDWNLMVIINLNPQNNEYGDLYSVGIR
ncbi:hypothetical protein CO051_02760 [Candidatus Roizmanbacteria bacterium CG_4_9_14_0_2_um_filter_39_13]|uniref:PEGA domain-containing protein n=1 Tax=Candidatus Roizmanbacteria bacterium CG_4_9_14_0_2_um_filter_39_13 TaxID=1974839 RepID=A0A2M8F057_9BACT|nr:MAG: hypothetical protein COY15_02160 [Candidatus Roizmanbacteria bacterium CG_4_10_14_0_2_um_filter_39_12]PJC32669.1 MAG: hypothetical protein CO051_02760 [Candidatus Roizmanbacteria bacterium CG_4_9_14_0_2_um_filter_39_13]